MIFWIITKCYLIILGNDAIVAFARRYEVVVVIHQLNEALWKIGEETKSTTPSSSSEKGICSSLLFPVDVG